MARSFPVAPGTGPPPAADPRCLPTLRPQPETSNLFLETVVVSRDMGSWTFLSNHGRVLLFLARDPGMRLRDIAARAAITERSAYGIVTDLAQAGYIVKHKDGRRNRYQIQAHLPLPEPASQERTVGEILALLTGTGATP
jgi:MarR family